MVFEFEDKCTIEARDWNFDDKVRAWNGLRRLLDELKEEYRSHTQSEGKPSELDYHKDGLSLYRLGEVLMTNSADSISIRNTPENGEYIARIEVRVTVSGDRLRVAIEDNGRGVDPEIEPYLFTSLLRAPIPENLLKGSADNKDRIPGRMGDELRQVKDEIEELEGIVFYQNKGNNVGAIFGYEVPISSLRVQGASSE